MAAFPPPPTLPAITDDTGAQLRLTAHPARIVSLAPGATEMLFAAGAGERIIATVQFSTEPAAARSIERVGDSQAVDLERIVALAPDVIVVWPGGNSAAQIATLERLRMPIYRHRVARLADLPDSIERLGVLAGTSAVAQRAAAQLRAQLKQLAATYQGRRELSVLLEIWDHPIYTVGGTHLMSDALHYCGARNIFGDLTGASPTVTEEAVIARDPDVIVAAAPGNSGQGWLASWRRFAGLAAVRRGNLIAFEDQRLSRLGPSAVLATEQLCERLARAR
ncbi:MAG TPA: helical backbone metal receptor [Steroidobacteraceae bacterium]